MVGLTPMYNVAVEIVEPLRARSRDDMAAQYAQLMNMQMHLEDILDKGRNEA